MADTKLMDLATRCERATGSDHLFDAEIAKAVGWLEVLAFGFSWQGPHGQRHNDCPRYTASLDAAMTLVPGGWRVAAICEREPWFCRLETRDFDSVTWGKGSDWITEVVAGQDTTAKAATPALALCAAALRAAINPEAGG